jgi:hypothetical protein
VEASSAVGKMKLCFVVAALTVTCNYVGCAYAFSSLPFADTTKRFGGRPIKMVSQFEMNKPKNLPDSMIEKRRIQ